MLTSGLTASEAVVVSLINKAAPEFLPAQTAYSRGRSCECSGFLDRWPRNLNDRCVLPLAVCQLENPGLYNKMPPITIGKTPRW